MTVEIIKYSGEYKSVWDSFISRAKNFHFMFFRDYMEYHSDRYNDFSCLIYNKQKLVSVIPASIDGSIVNSHAGLTFGGFISDENMTTPVMMDVFTSYLSFLKVAGVDKLIYKTIPYIYCNPSSEEDRYALFVNNAHLKRRDVSSTIDFSRQIDYQDRRKRAIKKGIKNGLIFTESDNYEDFWKILSKNLLENYNKKPVHSLEEIFSLKNKFPEFIKLFTANRDLRIIAGIVVYINPTIVHAQYISSSEEGRECGALDFLIDNLIKHFGNGKKFFDFGISTEDQGYSLNLGLIEQKEGFGARAVVHDFYELNIV